MTISTLPTFDDPFYSYATTLEGREYLLKFRFNQREDVWYLSLYMPDETPLVTGIKMLDGTDLIQRADERLPPGKLFAYSNSRNNTTAGGLEEVGKTKRVMLVYVSSDELE